MDADRRPPPGTPELLRVTVPHRRVRLGGHPAVLVTYEEWSDRSVVRFAVPGAAVPAPLGDARAWALRLPAGGLVRATSGGLGSRGGLNAGEAHWSPAVAYQPGLAFVLLDAAGDVVESHALA